MDELNSTKALVNSILETDERARNSDSYLYLAVLGVVADREGIDLNKISVVDFLKDLSTSPFPPFETVRRNRQTAQAKFPELGSNKRVKSFREAKEKKFRAFARSEAHG